MAQVAAWMKQSGSRVTGSDEGIYPPMGDFLRAQDIEVLTPYRTENLRGADQVVVGNALSRGNPEVEAVLEQRLPFTSLPQLLHEQILRHNWPLVVAGTHGKTTTSAALAQLLMTAELNPGYLIGGLPIGWEAGFAVGEGRWFVIEGDEYDTAFFDKRPKFLHYQPQVVLLNNIEFDHADIYPNIEEIYLQFGRLINLLPRTGCLIVNADEPNLDQLARKSPCEVRSFGLGPQAQIQSELIEQTPEGMRFRLRFASGEKVVCSSTLWGRHQLMNLTGAAAAAEFAGVSPSVIARGIEGFRGVQRRLELKFNDSHRWLYDDFAHHPTAVQTTLSSLRARHPGIPIVAAFEPRSNTMVRNHFQAEILESLALADAIILGNIHREDKIPPDQRLDVAQLLRALQSLGKETWLAPSVVEDPKQFIRNLPDPVVMVIMSNGAFSGLREKLQQELESNRSLVC